MARLVVAQAAKRNWRRLSDRTCTETPSPNFRRISLRDITFLLTLKALGIGLVPSVPLRIRRKWLEQANVSRYLAFGALGRDIGNRFNLFFRQ